MHNNEKCKAHLDLLVGHLLEAIDELIATICQLRLELGLLLVGIVRDARALGHELLHSLGVFDRLLLTLR